MSTRAFGLTMTSPGATAVEDDRPRADEGAVADGDNAKDQRACTDGDVIADRGRFAVVGETDGDLPVKMEMATDGDPRPTWPPAR